MNPSLPPYLLHHIDALIGMGVGLIVCWIGYVQLRARRGRHRSSTQKKAAKWLRICGPALVVISGLLLIPVPREKAPWTEAGTWMRVKTLDGGASAEFPGKPEGSTETDTDGAVSVQRTSLVYKVPMKDISLHLSFGPQPAGMQEMSERQRMDALKSYFIKQGFTIVHDSVERTGDARGIALEMQRDAGKMRVWVCTAVSGGNVYRVVASASGDYDDDPLIKRFLGSFKIEGTSAGAESSAPTNSAGSVISILSGTKEPEKSGQQ